MTRVDWHPPERRPPDAAALEAALQAAFPAVNVKLSWTGQAWHVRALRPAALGERGGGFAGRDASAAVAAWLDDRGHPAIP